MARNGFGLNEAEADRLVRTIETRMILLPEGEAVYRRWREFVVAYAVSGVQVHDARLAAAMNVNGVANILTFNTGDFDRFPSITPLHPEKV